MMQKISVSVLLLLGMFAGAVGAETYTWVDSSGTTNFTEDISQVPKKYLKKVRVRGDVGPVVSGGTESTAEAVSPASGGSKAVAGSSEKKEAMYGSKTGKSWKAEFETLRAQIVATDDQISELNTRLGDTSKMSRSDYLGIQGSLRNLQFHRGELEKKQKALNVQASQAGVPGEFR